MLFFATNFCFGFKRWHFDDNRDVLFHLISSFKMMTFSLNQQIYFEFSSHWLISVNIITIIIIEKKGKLRWKTENFYSNLSCFFFHESKFSFWISNFTFAFGKKINNLVECFWNSILYCGKDDFIREFHFLLPKSLISANINFQFSLDFCWTWISCVFWHFY